MESGAIATHIYCHLVLIGSFTNDFKAHKGILIINVLLLYTKASLASKAYAFKTVLSGKLKGVKTAVLNCAKGLYTRSTTGKYLRSYTILNWVLT